MSWETRPLLMSMTAAVSATDRPAWRSSRATRRDSLAAWCRLSIASAVIFRARSTSFSTPGGHGQVNRGVIGVEGAHRGHEVAYLLGGGGQGAAVVTRRHRSSGPYTPSGSAVQRCNTARDSVFATPEAIRAGVRFAASPVSGSDRRFCGGNQLA